MNFPNKIKINGRVRVCLELVKKLELKGKILVDIGSSFGWLEKEIADMGLKRIVGVEPNKHALEFARKNVQGVEFRGGSALKTGLADSFSDIIVLFDVIEHVPKYSENKAFDEVRRILKKGGTLLLSTPYNHFLNDLLDPAWYFGHRHYSTEAITKLLKSSGFELEWIEVKGKFWTLIYLLWFYINKWMFMGIFRNFSWLDNKYDRSFEGRGINTIYILARKL